MDSETMSRRRMLVGAGGAAAGAALLFTGGPAGAQDDDDDTPGDRGHGRHDGLVGTWLVTHTDDPTPSAPEPEPGVTVVSFVPGGVVLARDINPAGPPGQGAWERRGDDGFDLAYLTSNQVPPEPGSSGPPLVFVITVKVTGTLLDDGTMGGTYSYNVVDAAEDPVAEGTGTFTGTRYSVSG